MGKKRSESDEHYLIDLCDEVLGLKARRQHRFEFLIGDPSPTTQRCVKLPVDAFYTELQLVVEVMERQHDEAVALFDSRKTLSGIPRGEQRRLYDERRKAILPQHGVRLIVLDIAEFEITSKKKLRRDRTADLDIVKGKLNMAKS